MKSVLLLSVFSLLCLNSFCQIKGIDLSKAKTMTNDSDVGYEELLCVIPDSIYIIPFELTEVGLWHCVEKAKKIVALNDLNFDSPNVSKEELFADNVKGITDYSNLRYSLLLSKSEVTRVWETKSGDKIMLFLSKKVVAISFNMMNK